MDTATLIDQLTRTLMDAYQELPLQAVDGPLGEQINAVLHAAQAYLFDEGLDKDRATDRP